MSGKSEELTRSIGSSDLGQSDTPLHPPLRSSNYPIHARAPPKASKTRSYSARRTTRLYSRQHCRHRCPPPSTLTSFSFSPFPSSSPPPSPHAINNDTANTKNTRRSHVIRPRSWEPHAPTLARSRIPRKSKHPSYRDQKPPAVPSHPNQNPSRTKRFTPTKPTT